MKIKLPQQVNNTASFFFVLFFFIFQLLTTGYDMDHLVSSSFVPKVQRLNIHFGQLVKNEDFWDKSENARKFFDWMFKNVGFDTMEDFYHRDAQRLIFEHGGGSLLRRYRDS